MTGNSTEILQKMVEADGYIQVVRGPTDEYITVCRPNGTALFEGLLPREILQDFRAAWFVEQDGPENERGVTIFRLTNDARRAARAKNPNSG
jgi:hypothetical protein